MPSPFRRRSSPTALARRCRLRNLRGCPAARTKRSRERLPTIRTSPSESMAGTFVGRIRGTRDPETGHWTVDASEFDAIAGGANVATVPDPAELEVAR